MATPNLEALMETAFQISIERREVLTRLRSALEADEKDKALEFARELCGLDHEQKSNRTDPRIN